MNIRNTLLLGLCLLFPVVVFADFQYDEMTQVTGGSIVSIAKFASHFSKDARSITDPVNSTILVKGNRMARINPEALRSSISIKRPSPRSIPIRRRTPWSPSRK